MKTQNLKVVFTAIILATMGFGLKAQDRLFTYTYQSNVLGKGQRELEVWNTARMGKSDYFFRLDHRTEFEMGLGKNLQTAFYLNLTTKTFALGDSLKSLITENEISFSNEWKLKLMDPVAHPFGLALYAEYGIGGKEFELEGKILLDKKIKKFTFALNGVYEFETEAETEDSELLWEKESKLVAHFAIAYSINPNFHLTMENQIQNVIKDRDLEHSALFSGLGFSYSQENYFINFSFLPQIVSFKASTNKGLDLNEFEKVQCRLLFSYVL